MQKYLLFGCDLTVARNRGLALKFSSKMFFFFILIEAVFDKALVLIYNQLTGRFTLATTRKGAGMPRITERIISRLLDEAPRMNYATSTKKKSRLHGLKTR